MHTFQPMDLKYFDQNPFKLIGKDWMVITAQKDNKVNAMTASWGGVGVMWGKDVAYIVVRESRYTKEFIDSSDTFSLSFFNSDLKEIREALNFLGTVSGRDNDKKIKDAHLKVNLYVDENKHETPFIDDASLVLIGRKMFAQELTKESFIAPEIANWYKDGDYQVITNFEGQGGLDPNK